MGFLSWFRRKPKLPKEKNLAEEIAALLKNGEDLLSEEQELSTLIAHAKELSAQLNKIDFFISELAKCKDALAELEKKLSDAQERLDRMIKSQERGAGLVEMDVSYIKDDIEKVNFNMGVLHKYFGTEEALNAHWKNVMDQMEKTTSLLDKKSEQVQLALAEEQKELDEIIQREFGGAQG